MVVVSHVREFLDNVCTKIVETERGVATTYKGNYTQYRSEPWWFPRCPEEFLLRWRRRQTAAAAAGDPIRPRLNSTTVVPVVVALPIPEQCTLACDPTSRSVRRERALLR